MLPTLQGLDHVVVAVHDLDAAADKWRSLGFTLSPRGTHSAHVGTGNYTIVLDLDYVELLGVLQDTDLNEPSRAFLQRHGDGIERAALTTGDAATGVAALRALGIEAKGPVELSRPVELPEGGDGEASFSVFLWPDDAAVADLRIFACQHHTRGMVWTPALQSHANTAFGIARLELVSKTPYDAARHLARLIDSQALLQSEDDTACVLSAPGRGDFVFLTREAFLARHRAARPDTLPEEGVAALVLRVKDLDTAAHAAAAAIEADSVTVTADRANGVTLVFERE